MLLNSTFLFYATTTCLREYLLQTKVHFNILLFCIVSLFNLVYYSAMQDFVLCYSVMKEGSVHFHIHGMRYSAGMFSEVRLSLV